MAQNIGVIGLGAMGYGMARSLLRAGFKVYGYDIRQAVLDQFAADNGIACDTPAALARQCDVVITVVVNAEQTEAVLFGADGACDAMSEGSVVLACATVAPDFAAGLAERLAQRG